MTAAHADPDRDLVQACANLDSDEFDDAFEALYQRYKDRVYGIAFRITGNAVDAMDAVQESFALLFRNVSSFRFDSRFSTWLFRLVVNCSIDVVRARNARWRRDGSGATELDGSSANGPSPIQAAQVGELSDLVQSALSRLSPKLRAILALRYLEGMSYDELRDALQVSMGTVKSRLARAHTALERVMQGSPAFGEAGYVA